MIAEIQHNAGGSSAKYRTNSLICRRYDTKATSLKLFLIPYGANGWVASGDRAPPAPRNRTSEFPLIWLAQAAKAGISSTLLRRHP